MKKLHKCLNKDCKKLTTNKRCCCQKCDQEYRRKNRIGFYNPEVQLRASILGSKANIKKHSKNKTGMFAKEVKIKAAATRKKMGLTWSNPEIHKICIATMVRDRKGWFSKKARKKAQKTCKEKGIGIYGISLEERGNIAAKSLETIRNNSGQCYFSVYYDSPWEAEIGLCIHYQIEKVIYKINNQFRVGSKHIDFFIKKYNCFIEFHPIRGNETYEEYFNNRRKILNDNGYKNYNLIVIP